MTITEVVQMQGHLIDSGALSRALDDILESGADYEIQDLVFGKQGRDECCLTIGEHGHTAISVAFCPA